MSLQKLTTILCVIAARLLLPSSVMNVSLGEVLIVMEQIKCSACRSRVEI